MKPTLNTLMEICHVEALVRQAYYDNHKPPVLTWGVGLATTGGHDVAQYIGKPQPLQKCLDEFVKSLDKYVRAVNRTFAGYTLTEEQFTAALSFHYNTGEIHTAQWVKDWKALKFDKARQGLGVTSWRNPVDRRKAERELFFDGKWSNDGTMTEYTQVTTRRTPKWSSAIKIRVKNELSKALIKQYGTSRGVSPTTDALTGKPDKPAVGGVIGALIALLKRIFAK